MTGRDTIEARKALVLAAQHAAECNQSLDHARARNEARRVFDAPAEDTARLLDAVIASETAYEQCLQLCRELSGKDDYTANVVEEWFKASRPSKSNARQFAALAAVVDQLS